MGFFRFFPMENLSEKLLEICPTFGEVSDAMVQLDGVPTLGPVSRGPRPKAKAFGRGRDMVKQQMLETQRRDPKNSHG